MRIAKNISLLLITLVFIGLSSTVVIAEDYYDEYPWEYAGSDAFLAGLSASCCFLISLPWIIGLLIAIWVYKDAEKRGKSGILWLIVVWLIPFPIGLIIWLIVRPPLPVVSGQNTININQNVSPNASSGFSNGRRCPNCGRDIPMDAIMCPYCGKNFK